MLDSLQQQQGAKPCTSTRESAYNYHTVIVQLGRYRVIECRDAIQWIIQIRRGKSGAEPRWRSLSYCTTQAALMSLWAQYTAHYSPALGALPLTIGGC